MTTTHKQTAPGWKSDAAQPSGNATQQCDQVYQSEPTPADYVVLVRYDRSARRRVYLSLASAQIAAERAEKSGRRVDLVLCHLTPVRGQL